MSNKRNAQAKKMEKCNADTSMAGVRYSSSVIDQQRLQSNAPSRARPSNNCAVLSYWRANILGVAVSVFVLLLANPANAIQENNDEPVLPWEREPQYKLPQLTQPSERELLVDISEEELISVNDGIPINRNQNLFTKLLYRVSRFGLNELYRLSNKSREIDTNELETRTGFHRFTTFALSGKTHSWEGHKLAPAVGELFDLSVYYKTKLTTNQGQNVVVYSLAIPDQWKRNKRLREDVRFAGLFVNTTLSKDNQPILNFVADRLQWVPKSQSELVTTTGPALLGSAGFDLGLLDLIKTRNRRRLDAEDTESFYQMMKTARVISDSKDPPDWENKIPEFDLIKHLKTPQNFHGGLSLIAMEVRNVTRVKVDAEYISQRIGIQEYFQLDGFIKFDSSVTYNGEGGKQGAVFKEKYPVCVCLNRLPKGWKVGGDQNYLATFPVFFFKIWSYPTGFQSKFSADALQQSPLFVGLDPTQAKLAARETIGWMNIFWFSVIGVGVISIWTTFYLSRAKKDRSASHFQLPSKVEIPEIEIPEIENESETSDQVADIPIIRE